MSEQTQLDVVIRLKDELSSRLNAMSGTMGKVSNRFSSEFGLITKAAKLATVGVASLGAGIVGLGIFAVKNAAKMETMRVSLNTAFQGNKEEAKKAFDQINKFTSKTPFQLEEVMTSFIKLKNMGLDPSEEAMESYGDTASAMGKGLEQMVEAVADAATGEFERLKEFGIKAKSEGDNVTLTFRGVETTIKKDAASIEGYLVELGKTEFAGGMADQSETLTGKISTFKDQLILTSAAMAEESGIVEILKGGLNNLMGGIEANKDVIVAYIKDAVENVIAKTKAWVESVGGAEGIKAKLMEMWDVVKNQVIPGIKKLVDIVVSVTKFIWKYREAIIYAIAIWEAFKIAISAWEVYSAVKIAIMGMTTAISGSGGLSLAMKGLTSFIFSPVGLIAALAAVAAVITTKAIKAFKDLQVYIDEYNKTTKISQERIQGFKEHIEKLPEGEYKEKMKVMVAENEKMNEEVSETIKRYEGWKGAIYAVWDTMADFYYDMKGKMSKLSSAQDKLGGGGGGGYATGGVVHASNGYFSPKGTDTIPAMLTPGEMVLNAKQQSSLFEQLNGSRGGSRNVTININGEQNYYNEQSVDNLIDKVREALSREQEKTNWGIA